MPHFSRLPGLTATALALVLGAPAMAQEQVPTYTLYGTPGLIEMPTAQSAPDGEIGLTYGAVLDQRRTTFTFQVTPRISGSFRYSRIDEFFGPGEDETYDRSFDLRVRVLDESRYLPAVAVGLQDFLGTGLLSGEYVVATKTFGGRVAVTGGLGWGRLGSQGGFENPLGAIDERFEVRPEIDFGEGGTVNDDVLFRGDAAPFGGVSVKLTDTLTFKAEYSSDAYAREDALGTFEPSSPVNFGLTYRPRKEFELGVSYLYGEELGISGTLILDPKSRETVGGQDIAPLPVLVRTQDVLASESWEDPSTAAGRETITGEIGQAMKGEGMTLVSLVFGDRQVRVRYVNDDFRSYPQGMGRIARILTHGLPPEYELFILEPVEKGLPVSSVQIRRSDMERLENRPGATQLSYDRSVIGPAAAAPALAPREVYEIPRFSWNIAPDLDLSAFDASEPLRAGLGVELSSSYAIRPNLIVSGAIRQSLGGNLEEGDPIRASGLEPVRTNVGFYNEVDTVTLKDLTLAYYFKPGQEVFGRVTAGYLERMFGGVSSELLWSPVNSRLALGLEVNAVQQREFEQGLGFQDYDVVTGHVSAYYDFDNGFMGQVDMGRYLAGDTGATVSLDREFDNGFRVGGYFTLTDATEEDFGEGSFDKGIRISIPVDWFLGTPSRRTVSTNLSSLTRDGGQRVRVGGRLYDTVKGGQNPDLSEDWGRFWR
ncbi:YjbH domain-containing protein [Aestuariibius insulae]|uniref:YjbH domain-containing protein n=1 Tax=Aestuariibius insulae TaxID=2058287 RepID=UPI00345F10B8